MIKIVYDGLATFSLNSEGCACCLCAPSSQGAGDVTAKYSAGGVPIT